MCLSLALTCSWQDTYGNTTTCCGFRPQPGPISEEKRLMTVAWSWKVMTGSLWRSIHKDAIPQVHKHEEHTGKEQSIVKQAIVLWIILFYSSVCGAGLAESGSEHDPPVAACQWHGGWSQSGCQLWCDPAGLVGGHDVGKPGRKRPR